VVAGELRGNQRIGSCSSNATLVLVPKLLEDPPIARLFSRLVEHETRTWHESAGSWAQLERTVRNAALRMAPLLQVRVPLVDDGTRRSAAFVTRQSLRIS
jgi:hypothetical protein